VWTDSLGASTVWSSTGVTLTVLSDNGTTQQVRANVPAGPGGRRFLRIVVSTGVLTFPAVDPNGPAGIE
jgi:hypothetical protein